MTDSENVLQLVDIIGDILTYISYLYALAAKRKNNFTLISYSYIRQVFFHTNANRLR